jgi:GTP-binding protein
MPKSLPSVVLVGRPNVGKSTLFNRLTRTRRAIVTPIAGTTRDVLAQPGEWLGRRFEVTDTGGMFGASEDPLHALVLERGRRAIGDADLLVLVVDGREGLVPGDREIAEVVRAADRPTILAINKTDDKRARAGAMEFFQLGFDPVFEISAEHGQGTGDLLDAVVERLPERSEAGGGLPGSPATAEPGPLDDLSGSVGDRRSDGPDDRVGPVLPDAPERPRRPGPRDVVSGFSREHPGEVAVAIVGRPNAGKSSLVNRLLREERMIVSEMPGTTRDAVDTMLTWHRRQFRIVDTAGIRRAGRVAGGGQVEQVSVLLARRAIEGADVVVMVIDAAEGATDQDAAIAGEADHAGRGVIVVANKWDLMKGQGPDFSKGFDEGLRRQLKFLDYATILHLSALTGERTGKLLEAIDKVAESRRTRVKTHALNVVVERISAEHPPASPGRRHVRILYAAQTNVAPPTFVFFTNVATSFHFSYTRFLENKLRETFGFEGTPIRIQVRARREKQEDGGKGRGDRGKAEGGQSAGGKKAGGTKAGGKKAGGARAGAKGAPGAKRQSRGSQRKRSGRL